MSITKSKFGFMYFYTNKQNKLELVQPIKCKPSFTIIKDNETKRSS